MLLLLGICLCSSLFLSLPLSLSRTCVVAPLSLSHFLSLSLSLSLASLERYLERSVHLLVLISSHFLQSLSLSLSLSLAHRSLSLSPPLSSLFVASLVSFSSSLLTSPCPGRKTKGGHS